MIRLVTHDGSFHVDDVFAVATLLLVYPDAEVIRSRDEEVIKNANIVVDVGGVYNPSQLRFDHHQPEGAGQHENGIPYASFGLMWKEYGQRLFEGSAGWKVIEERLVSHIDAIDNGIDVAEFKYEGVRPYTIGDYIYSYLDRDIDDPEYILSMFMKVVGIAKDLLKREIENTKISIARVEEARGILKLHPDEPIVVLDKPILWEGLIDEFPHLRYVVYPRKGGMWGVKAAPDKVGSFILKKPFPEAWAGKSEEDLIQCTGVKDAFFAHKARFLVVAKSREGAIKLAEIALNS